MVKAKTSDDDLKKKKTAKKKAAVKTPEKITGKTTAAAKVTGKKPAEKKKAEVKPGIKNGVKKVTKKKIKIAPEVKTVPEIKKAPAVKETPPKPKVVKVEKKPKAKVEKPPLKQPPMAQVRPAEVPIKVKAPEKSPVAVLPVEVKKVVKEPPAPPKEKIKISDRITVGELAEKLKIKHADLIKTLMKSGIMASINQRLDIDTATLGASEYGFDVEVVPLYGEELIVEKEEAGGELVGRSPVVTIMGHVDHGKTTLLDAIRETNVTATEAGHITQHIGAYKVKLPKGEIVFLDTPGHEAFTAMRARGAQITDIVILVVAADDGIMPQTVEAIDHAKAAGVPIMVAINKVDLPQADTQRIKQELNKYNLTPEEWGGKTICVEVSALKKIGLEHLMEMILLEAEMLELKAPKEGKASGVVIEARLDKRRGRIATLLVQKGTLGLRDVFISGSSYGKIRAMFDDKGAKIDEAGPSTPVGILGLDELPHAGDRFNVVDNESQARQIVTVRAQRKKEEQLGKVQRITLEDLHDQMLKGKIKELNIIVKADVQGSVQALKDSLEKLSNAEIKLNVIHSGVGGINENDVTLASASNAIIIGFNVRPDAGAKNLAEKEGVDVRIYRIIYEVIDSIKQALEGLLEPTYKEVSMGRAEVREVFKIPKGGTIAGSFVTEGKILRNASARITRDNVIVYEGKISSLRRFKEDVKEVGSNYECGIFMENFNDIKKGDIIEVYDMEKVARKLE
ncbi:MAG: translation initiation factor IF-2 [bacterium]